MYLNWAIRKPINDGWVVSDVRLNPPTKFFYSDKIINDDND